MNNSYDIRPHKGGETVFIKGTKIKATVVECKLIKDNTWVYSLDGWPGVIHGELIETAEQTKR